MAAIWALALGLVVFGTLRGLRHRRRGPSHLDAPFALYPVTVLKPLKGVDAGLEANLISFFELDYPIFELLFSVADPFDPACEVVQRLMRRYPGVRAELIVGQVELGTNPKVNNLAISYQRAHHDMILISDSNVRVDRDYIRRMVAHLIQQGVGMVTSVVSGQEARGLGGFLETIYLNTFYARAMHIADGLGRPCVIGKSMLFQKSVARRFGGIHALAHHLAEDYMAGEAMRKLGLRVVIASDPIKQHIGEYTFSNFWQRHLRWGRIRKAQAPLPFLVEPLVGCFVAGVIGAIAAHALWGVTPSVFFGIHLALWSLADLLVAQSIDTKLIPEIAATWFVRELIALPLWIHISLGNTVQWRGRALKIQPGGLLKQNS